MTHLPSFVRFGSKRFTSAKHWLVEIKYYKDGMIPTREQQTKNKKLNIMNNITMTKK